MFDYIFYVDMDTIITNDVTRLELFLEPGWGGETADGDEPYQALLCYTYQYFVYILQNYKDRTWQDSHTLSLTRMHS